MGRLQPKFDSKMSFPAGFDAWWLVTFGEGQTSDLLLSAGAGRGRGGCAKQGSKRGGGELGASLVGEL